MSRIPRILAALVLAFVVIAPAATDAAGDRKAAIRNVIEQQLEAFRRDDAGAAFAHASPTIQQKFGDPAAFMRMVREGYRPVYRPQAVEFRSLAQAGSRMAQHVFLVGPEGRAVIAVYLMAKQADGGWRIDGVYLEDAADEAV
jgi:hypothetical protein